MRQDDKQVTGGEDLWTAGELMCFYRNPQGAPKLPSPHRVPVLAPVRFINLY